MDGIGLLSSIIASSIDSSCDINTLPQLCEIVSKTTNTHDMVSGASVNSSPVTTLGPSAWITSMATRNAVLSARVWITNTGSWEQRREKVIERSFFFIIKIIMFHVDGEEIMYPRL